MLSLADVGIQVSRFILGMATYGTKKDVAWRIEEEEALQHLKVNIHCLLDQSFSGWISSDPLTESLGTGLQHIRYVQLLL